MASRIKTDTGITDALIKKLGDLPEKIQKTAKARLYSLSPVDTGDYRAGWRTDLDNDSLLIYNVDTPEGKKKSLERGSSSAAPSGVLNIVVKEIKYEIQSQLRRAGR